MAWIFFMCRQN